MGFIEIANIVIIVLCAVTYGLMLYFRVKGDITESVSELIALAETTGLPGNEKMAQVVTDMYDRVPKVLRKILNKDALENIAQWIFEWMRHYADTYKEASEKKELETALDIGEAVSLIIELQGLTVDELRYWAAEHGVATEELKTKREIMYAAISAILTTA